MAKEIEEFEELEKGLDQAYITTKEMQLEMRAITDPEKRQDRLETKEIKKKTKRKAKPKKSDSTHSYKDLSDPGNPFTQYDRFEVDMNWISEAHARAYEALNFSARELRKRDRIINKLRNELGKPPMFPEKVPGVDPPPDEEMDRMVLMHEDKVDKFASIAIVVVIFLALALFLAVVAHLVK